MTDGQCAKGHADTLECQWHVSGFKLWPRGMINFIDPLPWAGVLHQELLRNVLHFLLHLVKGWLSLPQRWSPGISCEHMEDGRTCVGERCYFKYMPVPGIDLLSYAPILFCMFRFICRAPFVNLVGSTPPNWVKIKSVSVGMIIGKGLLPAHSVHWLQNWRGRRSLSLR